MEYGRQQMGNEKCVFRNGELFVTVFVGKFKKVETCSGFEPRTRTLSKKRQQERYNSRNKAEFETKVYSEKLSDMRHKHRR